MYKFSKVKLVSFNLSISISYETKNSSNHMKHIHPQVLNFNLKTQETIAKPRIKIDCYFNYTHLHKYYHIVNDQVHDIVHIRIIFSSATFENNNFAKLTRTTSGSPFLYKHPSRTTLLLASEINSPTPRTIRHVRRILNYPATMMTTAMRHT